MKNRRTVIILAVILVTNIILAIVFRDFVRENVLIPILYMFWYVRLFLKSLGETCLWPLLLTILVVISLRILRSKKKSDEGIQGYSAERGQYEEGRVGFWMKFIRRKAMGIESLSFTSIRLKDLVLSVLAYKENSTTSQLEGEIAEGKLITPEEVQVLFQMRDEETQRTIEPPALFSRFISWIKTRSSSHIPSNTSDMSKLVQYLEEQLEIEHDDGNN